MLSINYFIGENMEEDPVEYEKRLLADLPPIEERKISTIAIELTPTVKSIQTRDVLTNVPPKREDSTTFNVGDLLWVKIPGYPHWPAMISRDPLDGRYAKSTANGFVYHVQYFGESTRNWIPQAKFWPFQGPRLILPNTNKAIIPKKTKNHERAVAEAIQASKLNPVDRVKKLTFYYMLTDPDSHKPQPKTPTSAKKKKTPIKTKPSKIKLPTAKTADESIYDFDETIEDEIQDEKPELIWSRPREQTAACFVCKSADGTTIECSHKSCSYSYHSSCLEPQSYPFISKSGNLTCPLHFCLTCYTDLPRPRDIESLKPTKRLMYTCLSCPTAFHQDDSCTAAGTLVLDGGHVQCPAHRETKNEKHVNVSWCFSCNEPGELICCESCPAAFHAECIDNAPENDEGYFCYDCQSRKQLHYGDIIWIKLGVYRWWPAKITKPSEVPENINKLTHHEGDFPVYFFGSHDYYWSHRGRVFVYVEEDGIETKSKSGSSDKKYKAALEEARVEYAARKATEEARMHKIKNGSDKPRFKLIKQNKPINNVSQSSPDDLLMRSSSNCECKPDGDILCGTDDCLNRVMMIECDPDVCPVGEKCKNQRFRRRQYPICVPFKTDNVGWGLRTTEDIKKGDFVIEYVGELIDEAECNRRMENKIEKGDTTFYFLTIDKDRIIDAGPSANIARFMNHSCQPNCQTQKWVVMGQTKVGLFAIHDIAAGSELTFNYNLDCLGNELLECQCKSDNCSGFIGKPTQKNGKKAVNNR